MAYTGNEIFSLKEEGVLTHATARMNLENIVTQEDETRCDSTSVRCLQESHCTDRKDDRVGPGRVGNGELVFNGCGASQFGKMQKFYRWVVVMVA